MPPITNAVDMMIAPNIQPVCCGLGSLLYLESSRPGPGVGVAMGAGVCRFCTDSQKASLPHPVPACVSLDPCLPVHLCRWDSQRRHGTRRSPEPASRQELKDQSISRLNLRQKYSAHSAAG